MFEGFTLVELVFVIALISAIAGLSQFIILPALGDIGCVNEAELIAMVINRAQFIAQYKERKDVQVSISANKYSLTVNNGHGTNQIVDEFEKSGNVSVWPNEFDFQATNGLLNEDVLVAINSSSSCTRTFTIEKDGTIHK